MMYFFKSFFLLCSICEVFTLQCVDHNNNPVDWYVLYKLPHIKKNKENKLIKSGYAYTYITSTSVNSWKLSTISIGSEDSIVGLTLKPLFSENVNNNTMYITYNDEPPDRKAKLKKGHTKGLVLGDGTGGFWLIHSVPRFPNITASTYTYPQTGTVYGQSFLCISLDVKNLNNVGLQLQYNEPQIYGRNIPTNLLTLLPHISDVINNIPISDPPWYSLQNIQTKNGVNFTSFAKSRNFGKDLYEDWLAPTLTNDLYVETWLNGAGRLQSNCSKPFSVNNIVSIQMETANITFDSALDHSKWAVSSKNDTYWICIGDINRAEHQKSRGGGTTCMHNKLVASSYRDCVTNVEPCNTTNVNNICN